MILVDTSVWVDHLRGTDSMLVDLLNAGEVLAHPFVIGELALGGLRSPAPVLELLHQLPLAAVATDSEVLHFIGRHSLSGRGLGYVDVHLLAAARLTAGASLWTRDKRLQGIAEQLAPSAPVFRAE
jgi:predicted nucleic acid-binding protein